MSARTCARCALPFAVGDQVVDVRIVTRVDEETGTVATDRANPLAHVLAHVECPENAA